MNSVLYLVSRCLEKISGGTARLIRYDLVAQPVRPTSQEPENTRPSTTLVDICRPDSPFVREFPRPAEIIAWRFRQGHECLCAAVGGRFAGYLWLARDHYDEDEVRCRFILACPAQSVWDYDVYVEPRFRIGRTFSRLWQYADRHLSSQGVGWSFSRISAFNRDSLKAHSRLGATRMFSATFLCIGKMQITITSRLPLIHVSLSENCRPTLELRPPN